MLTTDAQFTVNLQTEKLENGTFRPWASVVFQDGGRFKTMTLEMDQDAVFVVEGAAIQYAKGRITALLQRQNAQAEIRFSRMRKASWRTNNTFYMEFLKSAGPLEVPADFLFALCDWLEK